VPHIAVLGVGPHKRHNSSPKHLFVGSTLAGYPLWILMTASNLIICSICTRDQVLRGLEL